MCVLWALCICTVAFIKKKKEKLVDEFVLVVWGGEWQFVSSYDAVI